MDVIQDLEVLFLTLNSDCQDLGSEWERMGPWVTKLQNLKSLISLSSHCLQKCLTLLFYFYYPRILCMYAMNYDYIHLHFFPLTTSASSCTCLPPNYQLLLAPRLGVGPGEILPIHTGILSGFTLCG